MASRKLNPSTIRRKGVLSNGYKSSVSDPNSFLGLGKTVSAESALTDWFRTNYGGDGDDNVTSFLSSLGDAELYALLEPYYNETFNFLGSKTDQLDVDALENDIEQLKALNIGNTPALPDYNAIADEADAGVDAEMQALLSSLDDDQARAHTNFQNELEALNNQFADSRRQLMSNDYQKNAALMDTVGSSLSKARQSALEAGANAGLRLASNVNTLLSVQNKQAQTSLDTSNALAQQMLAQRQAAAGLRSDYQNSLDNYSAERRNLQNSSYERKQNARANAYNEAEAKYSGADRQWSSDYDKATSGNYLGERYKSYLTNNG